MDVILHALGMDEDDLELVVIQNDKNRFEWDRQNGRIRARQGHSVPVDLGLQPVIPPEVLYHGTTEEALDQIFREGLLPMRRQAVHLSRTVEVALDVAGRRGRGQAVILAINARGLATRNIPVWESTNGVFLVDVVPPELLSRLP